MMIFRMLLLLLPGDAIGRDLLLLVLLLLLMIMHELKCFCC